MAEGVPAVVPERTELATLIHEAEDYLKKSLAEATRHAYERDFELFEVWCNASALRALPAATATVAAYLAHLAQDHRPASISRKIASISVAHQAAGHPSPTRTPLVRRVLQGIKRDKGTAPTKKRAVTAAALRRIVDRLPDNLLGTRDRALLLLGYAGGFRRSELVGLDLPDLEFTDRGLLVTVRRSKTDAVGKGLVKGIGYGRFDDTCPVKALQSWLEAAAIEEGPLFRGVDRHGNISQTRLCDRAVALVVKRAAELAGLDPEAVAGHSLRSGFITDQHEAGTPQARIMKQTGHRDPAQLFDYFQVVDLLQDSLTARVGL